MPSLEQRLATAERVVDRLTHKLVWADLALLDLMALDDDHMVKVWVHDEGGNRPPYPVEMPSVRELMAKHGYRFDPDGWWRLTSQPIPEEAPEPVPEPPDAPRPEDEAEDAPVATEAPQEGIQGHPEVPEKTATGQGARRKWWDFVSELERQQTEDEDDS